MGIFLNKGSAGFRGSLNSEIYVDKTDMIAFCNRVLGTEQKFICVSRPRRFGKTMAANMIGAYYETGMDTRQLFEGKKLSSTENWDRYLNSFDVIRLDMAALVTEYGSSEAALDYMEKNLIKELKEAYPGILEDEDRTVATSLIKINKYYKANGKGDDSPEKKTDGPSFVFIIDEWDYFFRDAADNEPVKKRYVDLLRSLFKSDNAKECIALAYITGIQPIKRYESESALNNFREYTMLKPGGMMPYFGFTLEEVRGLCDRYGMDFEQARDWYDGYRFRVDIPGMDYDTEEKGKKYLHICGPNSLVNAMLDHCFDNYWINTAAFTSVARYISMNYDGLKDAVVSMLCGNKESVKVGGYRNDIKYIENKDDVLTVLIHLGYLAYDAEEQKAYIPNKEVWEVFDCNLGKTGWNEVAEAVDNSERLLKYTMEGNGEAVSEYIDECHRQNFSSKKYNDENSLNCCIKLAYYAAKKDYIIIDEMPTGYGFADVVFIPKRNRNLPAMVIELKWKKDADTAISQIKNKKYPDIIKKFLDTDEGTGSFGGENHKDIILVGISYDKNNKDEGHRCVIEKMILDEQT